MNPETKVSNLIMIAVSEAGHTVWRNNVGAFKAESGQWVKYGVGMKGGSDLIGMQAGTGKFIALEVKTKKGRASKEQLNFIAHVNRVGGIAGVVRSPAEALELLK